MSRLALVLLSIMYCSQTIAQPLNLQTAVAEALAENPSLPVLQARAEALAAVPDQLQLLPDPRLSINVVNLPVDSFSLTQEAMTQVQLGISQALPFPGKLALKAEAANHMAQAAKLSVDEKRLRLASHVKKVWWNIFYLDRATETVEKNRKLLDQFYTVAETRYQVGQGQQQDVLLAQLEIEKIQSTAITLQNLRRNEVIRLNALRGRESSLPVTLPGSIDESLFLLKEEKFLHQQALQLRPELAMQQRNIEAAKSRLALAKKETRPDFMASALYGVRGGENMDGSDRADFFSVMLSMNLPIYAGQKQHRNVDQLNAEWMQEKYEFQDKRNQIAAQISKAVSDYESATAQVNLYQQKILPQAEQTVDVMLAGYRVGKTEFLSLLQSQTKLYNYQTEYWKTFSVVNQALADLVAAVGEESVYE